MLMVPTSKVLTREFYANNMSRRGSQPESGFMSPTCLGKVTVCAVAGSFLSDEESQRGAGKPVCVTQLVLKIAQIGGCNVLGVPHK